MRVFTAVVAAVAAIGIATGSAAAATKKQQSNPPVMRSGAGTIIEPTKTIIRHQDGTTTVIVIPRRSYLDTGTEVSVGDRGYMDYMLPPGGNPAQQNWFIGPDPTGSGGYPLPPAMSIPGFNPYTPY